AKVKPQSTVVTLEIKGNMLTSEGLAKELESRMTRGQSDFTFIIGGSNGLHQDVLNRSDYALSFSKMTFPHQMQRVVLIEQVYRAFKIMRGEAYHKWCGFFQPLHKGILNVSEHLRFITI